MLIRKPSYFDSFRCIAGQCPDSCCKEWDVLVDPDKAAFYRSLPGDLGDRLRQVLKDEDGDIYMTIENRRCPMWRPDGLCRIQAELGETALCKTCREFPRLTHDYGDFIEYGLELSCPEAARIILSTPSPDFITEEVPGGEEPEYDALDMEILLHTRSIAQAILADRNYTVGESLILLIMFSYHAQSMLNTGKIILFDQADTLLAHARQYARKGDMQAVLGFFKSLEILTPEWESRLNTPSPAGWDDVYRTIARYFVDRYWLQAISDLDLISRAKFAVISCLVIKTLGGNILQTAQLYSKEIENSIENVESILEAVYSDPTFADAYLTDMLLF